MIAPDSPGPATSGSTDLSIPSPQFAHPKPDIFGDGYEALTAEFPDDSEGAVVVTLVRHRAAQPTSRAVLYLHGLSDYFHQRELAEFHAARGEDFYALDLRKNGRSLLPHQTPTRMADVSDYYPELDAAVELIVGDGHDHLVVNAHSTGGLVAVLWAHDRQLRTGSHAPIRAMILNSPFLDIPAAWAVRAWSPKPLAVLARNRPMMIVPNFGPSYYQHSINSAERGEWDFVEAWKPIAGGVVRIEWLVAAQRAIARAHAGLNLDFPILVLCAARTVRSKQWTEDFFDGDAVLDADEIARWSIRLGGHITCLRIKGGMHDLLLSKPAVRRQVYTEIARWSDTYADLPGR
jgi:alpha-beta hydrolase superfamily lysophospholipase